jgi:hypothetical protein
MVFERFKFGFTEKKLIDKVKPCFNDIIKHDNWNLHLGLISLDFQRNRMSSTSRKSSIASK